MDGKVAVWEIGSIIFEDFKSKKPRAGKPFNEVAVLDAQYSPVMYLCGHKGGVKRAALSKTGELSAVNSFSTQSDNAANYDCDSDPSAAATTLILTSGTDQQLLLYYISNEVNGILKLASHDRTPWATVKRDTLRAVVLSPLCQYMATFGIGCDVMLWEAATGRLILSLVGHIRNIRSVDFATESNTEVLLVSGDEEGKTILWNLSTSSGGSLEAGYENAPINESKLDNPATNDEIDESSREKRNSFSSPHSTFQHPREEDLVTWHHHRVPIRSVRFCGTPGRVVSCDAAGKVIVVNCATAEVLIEFLGGEVSCSPWNFWWRGFDASSTLPPSSSGNSLEYSFADDSTNDMFLVTTSLERMVIWDCESGRVASHRSIPPETGFIECYDISTTDKTNSRLSIACCTNAGHAFVWTPDRMAMTPEEDSDENKGFVDESDTANLIDLSAMIGDVSGLKNGFRGISFGPNMEIVAWGVHMIFLWVKVGDSYKYHDSQQFSAGESIFGLMLVKVCGDGTMKCVLEDGWAFTFETSLSVS